MKTVAGPAGSHAATTPPARAGRPVRVCMHVLGTARTDVRVMREATALVHAGYDVTVVDLERDSSRPRVEEVQGVRLKHVVMPGSFRRTRFKPWFIVKMAAMVVRGSWAVARAPAVVYHAHDDMALPACYAAARLRRELLVFDAHELPLVQPNITRWRRLCALAARALRHMAPRCDAVITVSAPIAAEVRRRYGGPAPVLVRNVPVYQPPAAATGVLRERLGLAVGTRIALYQGGLNANRNLDVLVRAGRYLGPDQVIVLMGNGPLKGTLEARIAAEEVGDRVRLLPAVPYEELLAWTASADLGLIIYRAADSLNVRYCLPNKLFEYLMAGVPVMATDLDAVAELLRTYDAGAVVTSLEPAEIGCAISRLLDDAEGRARMRVNALAAAASDLRWDVERQRLIDLYARLPIPVPASAVAHADAPAAAPGA